MRAVFHRDQLLHRPVHYVSHGTRVPNPAQPERTRFILDALGAAGIRVESPTADGAAALATVHDAAYLDFLASGFGRWRDETGSDGEIVPKIHAAGAGLTRCAGMEGLAGWYQLDNAVPVGEHTWTSVVACAATTAHAAALVAGGTRAAYALCRPGGHHALRGGAMGFCYLNNAAIAAERLRAAVDRVAVLDIHIHHGNGTQRIFESRADVVTLSVHADPVRFYPFYWGHADERGVGAGTGANHNLPLPHGSNEDDWLAAIDRALGVVERAAADALVVSLGVDGHRDDPMSGFALTTHAYAEAARRIAAAGLPAVIVQEGGCSHHAMAGAVTAFLCAFES